ncbi:Uncharacterized protein HZ326_17970 [Fusarium oxysporum f. sp. albedinis]|nr:Uncharacterized protein HZ326_17970 [Fusarium oxysporum f. sp. albedinis]
MEPVILVFGPILCAVKRLTTYLSEHRMESCWCLTGTRDKGIWILRWLVGLGRCRYYTHQTSRCWVSRCRHAAYSGRCW